MYTVVGCDGIFYGLLYTLNGKKLADLSHPLLQSCCSPGLTTYCFQYGDLWRPVESCLSLLISSVTPWNPLGHSNFITVSCHSQHALPHIC